jgi:hypothetical protein
MYQFEQFAQFGTSFPAAEFSRAAAFFNFGLAIFVAPLSRRH